MNIFDRLKNPLVGQGLLGFGINALSSSSQPGATLGGSLAKGLLGFQNSYKQAKDGQEKDARKKRIEGLLGDPHTDIGPPREGLLNMASPLEAEAIRGAVEAGDYGAIMKFANPTSNAFEGTGIEAQMLNSYLSTLPPDQRGATKEQLVRQRLSRPQVVNTPTGAYMTPGYNLSGGEVGLGEFIEKPDNTKKKEGREATSNFSRLDKAFSGYRDAISEHGTRIVPGLPKLQVGGAHKDLLLEMKELYNLGVLNGPDLEIMEQVVVDPTRLSSQVYGKKDILKSLDTIVQPKINAAKQKYKELYGEDFVPGNNHQTPSNIVNWSDL